MINPKIYLTENQAVWVTTFIQAVKDMREAQTALEKHKTKNNLARRFAMEKRIDKLLEATKIGGVKAYDERLN